jgi:hypothetical protein
MAFNFLSIDVKDKIIVFDDHQMTRELVIDSKFYAANIKGIESHAPTELKSVRKQSDISGWGITIGRNKNDEKVAVCLIYGNPAIEGALQQPKYLTMTIL